MGKRKSKLLKDSGSARRAIEEKCGGKKPQKVPKVTKRKIEEAATIANKRINSYKHYYYAGSDVKLF